MLGEVNEFAVYNVVFPETTEGSPLPGLILTIVKS